jgi:hypothetical protein
MAKYGLASAGVNASDGSPIDGQGDDAQPPDPPEQSGMQADNTPLGPEYTWETAGGTTHLTQAFETVSAHMDPALVLAGALLPNDRNAIGLSKDGVEGVDVPAPEFSWSVSFRLAFVTRKYLMTLRRLTGTVNRFAWFGRGVREIRFDGSSGRIGSDGRAEVVYRFTEKETQYNVDVGDMVITEVKGFDYLDIGYGSDVDQTWLIEVPKYARVKRIYRQSDFKELGIG